MERGWILTTGAFVLGTELFVIAGILPDLARDLGVGIPVAGQLVTVFAVVYGVSAPILAAATGRIPRRRLLVSALLAFAAGNALAATARGFGTMLASRIVVALAGSLFLPSALSLAVGLSSPRRRGRALSTIMVGLNLATVLGVPLGVWIASAWGWRWVFASIAAAGLATAAMVRGMLPESVPPEGPGRFADRVAVLREPGVLRGLAFTGTVLVGAFSVYTYLAEILRCTSGVDPSRLGWLLVVFGAFSTIGAWAGGRMADRMEPRRILPWCVGSLALALAGFSWIRSPAAAAVLLGVWGLSGGAFNPLQQHRLVESAPGNPSTVLAWNSSAVYLGQAIAGAWGGILLGSFGVSSIGVASGVLLLAGLAVLLPPRGGLSAVRNPPATGWTAGSLRR